MTLHAASRESLALAENALGEVLAEAGTEPATVGEELLSVVTLLGNEVGLRRAVSDSSSAPQARTKLARSLLEGKVSEPSLKVLDVALANRWSSPRELLTGIESLGRSALLTSAEQSDKLDLIEDQIFHIARVVASESELEQVLSDQTAPTEAKRSLIRGLLANKVDVVTETLVEQVVMRSQGRGVGAALEQLVQLAAERRQRSVAHVVSASSLSDEQRTQLATKLTEIYGREMALHIEIDPDLGGGLVVRVGDEVIDGSVAGQLAALRRRLAG